MKKLTAIFMAVLLMFTLTACGSKEDYAVSEKRKLGVYHGDFEIKANVFDYDITLEEMGISSHNLDENIYITLSPRYKYLDDKLETYEYTGFSLDVDGANGIGARVFYNKDGIINVSLEKENYTCIRVNIHDKEGYITHSKEIEEKTTLTSQSERDENGNISLLQIKKKDLSGWLLLIENGKLK